MSFPMFRRLFIYILVAVPFVLSGCGEGWEAQTTTSFPYGNKRTAGSAIAYVQAKILPEKSLNMTPVSRHLEPEALAVEEPAVEAVPAVPEVEDEPDIEDTGEMDKIFMDAQRK